MSEQLDLFNSSVNEEGNAKQEKRKQESKLTPRQWALYRLIYHNSLVEHRKTTQKEICEKLREYGYIYTETNGTTDKCSMIWSDVNANNMSFEHDKVIITKKYVYWIGSERETKLFLAKLWRDLSPRLVRYWNLVNKVGYDGLGKLYDKNLNEINYDEETENDIKNTRRFFHESFNEYDIELQKANKKLEEEKEEDQDVEE